MSFAKRIGPLLAVSVSVAAMVLLALKPLPAAASSVIVIGDPGVSAPSGSGATGGLGSPAICVGRAER